MASRTLIAAVRGARRIVVPRAISVVAPAAGIRWSSAEATSSRITESAPESTSASTRATPAEGASTPLTSQPAYSSHAALDTESSTAAAEGTSSTPSTEATSAPSPPSPEAWTCAGIHPDVADRLIAVYPQAVAPTPGQRAFLMTVMRGDTDVYLKDYMGRGKTFALVLTALSLACTGEHQVVLLLPTPHLAQQVSDLLVALAPGGEPLHTLVTEDGAEWEAPIIVATPRILNEAGIPELPHLSHILVDEPDTMLGPLPGRYLSPVAMAKHPINKHPPPVVPTLDRLLGIRSAGKVKGKKYDSRLDFGNRRANIRTVWASATFGPAMRRFVYGRGWALGNRTSDGFSRGVVDLNFTAGSTEAQRGVVETLRQIGDAGGIDSVDASTLPVPKHYALVVQASGRMSPLAISAQMMKHDDKGPMDDKIALPVVEAMAFIHATSPPPPGTYALVLPPRSGSMNALAGELEKLGIPVTPLIPEMLEGGIPSPEHEDDGESLPPMLLSPRTAVAGLHLPQLHTVYLLNGLDMASLTPAQLKLGGRHDRETQYGVIAGRLGRMGTDAAFVPGHPQRVISLVAQGSYEEHALSDLFAGRLSPEGGVPHTLGTWEGDL